MFRSNVKHCEQSQEQTKKEHVTKAKVADIEVRCFPKPLSDRLSNHIVQYPDCVMEMEEERIGVDGKWEGTRREEEGETDWYVK